MPIALKPFDPKREFVTATSFRAGGRVHGRGYAFPKDIVPERVLGILYNQRKIVYDDDPRAIDLMSGGGGRNSAKGESPDREGDQSGASPDSKPSEDEQVDKIMARNSKADLLAKAKNIPGVNRSMNKTQLATALVRSGNGNP